MSTYKPLPSNAAKTPSLFLDTAAPADVLLGDAMRRVEAVRNLAATLSMVSDPGGIQGRDLASLALVTEILTSDAVAILEAMESQFLNNEVMVVRHD